MDVMDLAKMFGFGSDHTAALLLREWAASVTPIGSILETFRDFEQMPEAIADAIHTKLAVAAWNDHDYQMQAWIEEQWTY